MVTGPHESLKRLKRPGKRLKSYRCYLTPFVKRSVARMNGYDYHMNVPAELERAHLARSESRPSIPTRYEGAPPET